ncbi:MAG: hypothetical protein KA258_04135 [Deltaproteobacteria bacterium]|jgi:hypothetical protein|nr:hypothetical protein [Deltaproteobacteria bacterium]MBP8196120.1 hypothetical protein [Deltaproteobacteria bacterium]
MTLPVEPLDRSPSRLLLCDLGLGLGIALAVVVLLLFAGTEDQGFIYVDF